MPSKPKNNPAPEQEYRDEAARLALLPVADQQEIIALHRSVASKPKVPKRERQAGMERAAALEKLLGLARKRPKRISRNNKT
jgi:hypothetical protein